MIEFESREIFSLVDNFAITEDSASKSTSDNYFTVEFDKNAIIKPFNLELKSQLRLPDPKNLNRVSNIYQYDIDNDLAIDHSIPIILKIKYNKVDSNSKAIYFYDKISDSWKRMSSYHNVEEHYVTAKTYLTYAPVAVLSATEIEDGIASWYTYKNCNCAASRDYPKGTKVIVTRLKTDKKIIVTINDYGPEEWTGRLIDLDKAAFEKIGSLYAGLIYVSVAPYD